MEIAEKQLERAIVLYLDEKDYISAITLAGASEEILGHLLKNNKLDNEMDELVNAFATEYGSDQKEDKKWFIEQENYHRNNLKHLKEGDAISIDPSSALRMIDRALSNFLKLDGKQSENIKRYIRLRN